MSTELASINGPWRITFPPNWGAPPEAKFDKLVSWTTSSDDGVKYFSGTATYSKEIQAPQAWFRSGAKIMLNLGSVREIAEVSLNGKPVGGILWKPPFRADITELLNQVRTGLKSRSPISGRIASSATSSLRRPKRLEIPCTRTGRPRKRLK